MRKILFVIPFLLAMVIPFAYKKQTTQTTPSSEPVKSLLEALCDTFDGTLNAEALASDDTGLRPIENYSSEMVAEGEFNYGVFCANCHGLTGEGEKSFGPALKRNVFTRGMSDTALLRFIINGRPADDPFNVSGVVMPPRAGFPNLSDEQILSIIAYLRVLDATNPVF